MFYIHVLAYVHATPSIQNRFPLKQCISHLSLLETLVVKCGAGTLSLKMYFVKKNAVNFKANICTS